MAVGVGVVLVAASTRILAIIFTNRQFHKAYKKQ